MLMPKAAEARRKGVSGQAVYGWSKNVLRRPTHYRDEWADWTPGLCKRGLTDAERARAPRMSAPLSLEVTAPGLLSAPKAEQVVCRCADYRCALPESHRLAAVDGGYPG